jgi:hypothetical protein
MLLSADDDGTLDMMISCLQGHSTLTTRIESKSDCRQSKLWGDMQLPEWPAKVTFLAPMHESYAREVCIALDFVFFFAPNSDIKAAI